MAMQIIFESETELGQCDGDRITSPSGDMPGDWAAFANTSATLTGSQGMLRIEQRCYLRSAERSDDVHPQAWVAPEMTFEPMLGSKAETMRKVRSLHDEFVVKSRLALMDQAVLAQHQRIAELAP